MRKTINWIILAIIALIIVISAGLIIVKASAPKRELKAHVDLGNKYLVEYNFELAKSEFSKVIELNIADADAFIGYANANIGLADIAIAEGKLEEAQSLYNEAKDVLEKGICSLDKASEIDLLNEKIAELTLNISDIEVKIKEKNAAIAAEEKRLTDAHASNEEATSPTDILSKNLKVFGLSFDEFCSMGGEEFESYARGVCMEGPFREVKDEEPFNTWYGFRSDFPDGSTLSYSNADNFYACSLYYYTEDYTCCDIRKWPSEYGDDEFFIVLNPDTTRYVEYPQGFPANASSLTEIMNWLDSNNITYTYDGSSYVDVFAGKITSGGYGSVSFGLLDDGNISIDYHHQKGY